MKGIQIDKINDNFHRSLEFNLQQPDLNSHEILVEVHFGGLNYADPVSYTHLRAHETS